MQSIIIEILRNISINLQISSEKNNKKIQILRDKFDEYIHCT